MGDEGRRCGQGAIAASDQIFERIVFGCVCVVCALVCVCVLVCVCCLRSGMYRFTDTYMHVFPHTNAHTRTSMYV